MKKILVTLLGLHFLLVLVVSAQAQKSYRYDSVPGDPMKVRIYTLDNGLKVYLTVYKDAPRIQTAIAVRTGSKNDPSDNTGMSHYLEHMMFKGSDEFGTRDYAAEKPLLEKIEQCFELYKKTIETIIYEYANELFKNFRLKQLFEMFSNLSFLNIENWLAQFQY